MLTSQQYEAVGRLTLGFNDIESVIDAYVCTIFHAKEVLLGSLIAEDGSFEQKSNRFKKVLKTLVRIGLKRLEDQTKRIADEGNRTPLR